MPPPRSLTPVNAERETAHLCDCPLSLEMIQLADAGIAMPIYHYGFYVTDFELWHQIQDDFDKTSGQRHCDAASAYVLALSNNNSDSSAGFQLTREPETKFLLVDSSAKDECPELDEDAVEGDRVMVLAFFSNTYPSYERRSTQEEIDSFARVLKQRPRWWRAPSLF